MFILIIIVLIGAWCNHSNGVFMTWLYQCNPSVVWGGVFGVFVIYTCHSYVVTYLIDCQDILLCDLTLVTVILFLLIGCLFIGGKSVFQVWVFFITAVVADCDWLLHILFLLQGFYVGIQIVSLFLQWWIFVHSHYDQIGIVIIVRLIIRIVVVCIVIIWIII